MSFSRFESSVTTVGFYLDNYEKILTDGITLKIFFQTVELSLMITLFCLLLGYPVAMLMRRVGPKARLWILLLVVSPLLTSIIVRNVAWVLILGRSGMINDLLISWGLISKPLPLMYNTFGVVLAVVHVYLSFMVLPLYSVMKTISPSLMRAGKSLGGTPFVAFWKVYFPLTIPGIGAGCLLVFILAIGYYITPALVGGASGTLISNQIAFHMKSTLDWSFASAMGLMLLSGVLAIYWVYNKLVGIDNIKLG